MVKKKAAAHSGTPATALLDARGISYSVHGYTHDPAAVSFGLEAAEALGVAPALVFKTLLVNTGVPGAHALAVGVVPVNRTLDLKAMAHALGVKKVEMADPAVAERRTGYVVGGISPLGQRNPSRTVVDSSALMHETVFISGGRRGLDLGLAPADLMALTGAESAPIAGH
ncbi:Cys-tRNA(Pro) deacylase [Paeniglutamicibacter cryotolerans]|uniref:Cys-tRNA(Pro)/Cys-tRNA(Cys) deacylase n=1 Tax=Paeniglutamicibacter cryotolerans TaxID=670079 RepID=A0A839QM96_9MICC|nr:Cys-tRNA(Pro) deacylase [Paeniglutamicibacter cryotolerans]MBB2996723.1 Cys-tRNA(Pro)/Cys-tRNA(Cys) deacylase [Paeniglutamicibacter cryotolerans]